MTRTGAEYLESLRDGRHIVIDGERVDDVTTHPAFARSVRSFARLYDIAGEQPDVMTFPSPTDGRPVNKAWFDDIQVYLSSSTDGGATWSPARVISSGSS
ncbi:MAG TPA: 4-hydroxyphenylacetate 3-hydroxylase N-terminal domain-containing protein, partial [Acidimicrobiales bacterium]|nr:4-hydroxyphenylacetate 3-hydroxylase N-terminal domain-containing protein [Acidimicrobiales bacterium]